MYDLFTCLDDLHPVSAELKQYLARVIKRKKISKYQYLLQSGDINNKIWFLEKGLVRCFYNDDDREVTMWFVNEKHAIVPSNNLFDEGPYEFYLQALEPGVVCYVDYEEALHITSHFAEANALRIKITEWYAGLLALRLQCLAQPTPKEKYNYFMRHLAYLRNRVTLSVIASYLDISRRTLIRLMHP